MRTRIISFSILGVAIAFVAVGIAMGEHEDVMRKAVRICLECIGLG